MNLLDFLRNEFLPNHEFGVSTESVNHWYIPAIRDFEKHLGRPATLDDLTRETVNAWIISRQATVKSTYTLKSRRNAVLALWRAAYDSDFVSSGPDRIRRLRIVKQPTQAWDRSELEQLISTVMSTPNRFLGKTSLPFRDYFRSMIMTAYETGLRLGDIFLLRPEQLRKDDAGNAIFSIIQHKTNRQKTCFISAQTVTLIESLIAYEPNRQFIWPLWCRRDQFYAVFRKLVLDAKIRKGTFRWIRRSSTTHVEGERPGLGSHHAGHADARVTSTHYIDYSQLTTIAKGPSPLCT